MRAVLKTHFTAALLIFTVYPCSVHADTAPLTLEKCVELVLAKNLDVKAQEENILAAQERVNSAKADFYPRLDIESRYIRERFVAISTDPSGDPFPLEDQTTYTTNLTIEQPVLTGGFLRDTLNFEKVGSSIEKVQREILINNLRYLTKKAYYEVLLNIELLDVAIKSREIVQTHLNTANSFYESGIVPKNDVLRAEIQLANSNQNFTKSKAELDVSMASLNDLLGFPMEETLNLFDRMEYRDIDPDAGKITDEALIKRPEIVLLKERIRQAGFEASIAKSNRYPHINLSGFYTVDSDDTFLDDEKEGEWGASAVLRWNLMDWGGKKADVSEALYKRAGLDQALKRLEETVRKEVSQALIRLKATRENYVTAQEAFIKAEEILNLYNERYKANMVNSFEFLDAEAIYTNESAKLAKALFNYLITIINLEKLANISLY